MAETRCPVCGGYYKPSEYGKHAATQRHKEAALHAKKKRGRKKEGLLSFNTGAFERNVRKGRHL